MKSLVLCSGGMDSAVCLALASREGEVVTLNINYGQKHQSEIEAARLLSEFYQATHTEVTLPDIFSGVGSTLIDKDKELPSTTYEELRKAEGPSSTYVPFRNANLLAVATAKALVLECDAVWFGAHAEDARNWAYPDCSPEFVGAMANAIHVGTYFKVRLMTPLTWMMKKDIVALGIELLVPFQLTRSCYSENRISCGKCSTCIERLGAFNANGIQDPIHYQTRGG